MFQPSFFDYVYPVQTTITKDGEVECLPVYHDSWTGICQFEKDTYVYPSMFVFWWDAEHGVYQKVIVYPQ